MRETLIFDPAMGYPPFEGVHAVTDATVANRDGRWWMYLAGKFEGHEAIQLVSASLPQGAPLSAEGWSLTPDPADPTRVAMLAPQQRSAPWDLKGGRHCPAYVRGPGIERIYYAGGAENLWGPYTIGYLEWDGAQWVEQPEPVLIAAEEWEHGSVFEPNVLYDEGIWKMWYVAGSHHEDYFVHGYAESLDGVHWTSRRIFAPPDAKMFDFCAVKTASGYEAVYASVWLGAPPAPEQTGLWWCHADRAYPSLSQWSKPVPIKGPGPWKPSLQYGENGAMFVFFDGVRESYVFTLSCLEGPRP
jgi:hypothetical protein